MNQRGKSRLDKEINASADKKLRRKNLRCALCPPNKGENAKRQSRHGHRKPKKKDKR